MEVILRNMNPNDILTILVLGSVIILAVVKYFFAYQFIDLLDITQFHKYTKLHLKKNTVFNPLMYLFFVLNTGVFIALNSHVLPIKLSLTQIFVSINVYVLGFYFVKKICFEVLELNDVMKLILFQKITINHYISLLFFIFNLIFLYIMPEPSNSFALGCIVLMALCYVFGLLYLVFLNLKWVLKHWFYFILYLCTFKISPILIGCYLISVL